MHLFKTAAGMNLVIKSLLLSCLLVLTVQADEDPGIQQIYSWKEKVRVYPSAMEFKAKLDSGAKTSSLNAFNIEEFKRDDQEWVRFTIQNWEKKKQTLERKIVRHVRIKEHDGGTQRRVVVKMGICLGTLYKEVDVNLVDRSHFTTGMLIGRSYMQSHVLIDPASTYTHTARCDRKPLNE